MLGRYTDSVGHEDYNYELGQRRATRNECEVRANIRGLSKIEGG